MLKALLLYFQVSSQNVRRKYWKAVQQCIKMDIIINLKKIFVYSLPILCVPGIAST